jgi:acyl-coenzyme A synthetase/AMP-(fatty) acid ligase
LPGRLMWWRFGTSTGRSRWLILTGVVRWRRCWTTVTAEELIAYGRETMAAYKYPRMVEIIDELPKTTTGKILRRQLREWPSPDQ